MTKANTVPLGTKSAGACLHTDLTLIEVADAELMHELRADRSVGPLIIAQVPDRVAIAAPGSATDLVRQLRKAGHTPKPTELAAL